MNKKLILLLHSIKRITLGVIFFGIVLMFFITPGATDKYTDDIKKARDTFSLKYFFDIQKTLENNEEFTFLSLKDYEKEFNIDIMPPKGCYYLSATENKKSYILMIPLESKKFKKKYGNDYYLYKSDEEYSISEFKMEEIKAIINNPCN